MHCVFTVYYIFILALTTYHLSPAQRGEGEVLPVWDSVWLGLQQHIRSASAFSFSLVQETSQCQTISWRLDRVWFRSWQVSDFTINVILILLVYFCITAKMCVHVVWMCCHPSHIEEHCLMNLKHHVLRRLQYILNYSKDFEEMVMYYTVSLMYFE